MPAVIVAALWKAWAFVLPLVGPLLARAAPFLGWVPGLAGIGKSLRVASYVAVLGIGAWGATKALRWWDGDKLTQREARGKCDASVAEVELRAKIQAVETRERALVERAASVERAAQDLETLKGELEHERAQVATTQPIGADDQWMRDWAKRGR